MWCGQTLNNLSLRLIRDVNYCPCTTPAVKIVCIYRSLSNTINLDNTFNSACKTVIIQVVDKILKTSLTKDFKMFFRAHYNLSLMFLSLAIISIGYDMNKTARNMNGQTIVQLYLEVKLKVSAHRVLVLISRCTQKLYVCTATQQG